MQRLAEMFKAMSDETRLRILAMLQDRGELCVCDVEGALRISQSKSSRHLRYLYNAGLVENRRAGTWVHYRLPNNPGPDQRLLLQALPDMIPSSEQQALKARMDLWFKQKNVNMVCGKDQVEV